MRLSAASRCISYKRGHSGSGYHGTHRAASSMSVFTGLLGLPDRPWHWSYAILSSRDAETRKEQNVSNVSDQINVHFCELIYEFISMSYIVLTQGQPTNIYLSSSCWCV